MSGIAYAHVDPDEEEDGDQPDLKDNSLAMWEEEIHRQIGAYDDQDDS